MKERRRVLLAALLALLAILALSWLAFSGKPRYRAESLIFVQPYTNVFFARAFEAQVVRTIPGIFRLTVTPTFSAVPGAGVPAVTNGVGIRILTTNSTPEDALRSANNAAIQLKELLRTNYAATAELADVARTARRYSYFHDRFEPGIARLFKH
jgi:hypothetical protein